MSAAVRIDSVPGRGHHRFGCRKARTGARPPRALWGLACALLLAGIVGVGHAAAERRGSRAELREAYAAYEAARDAGDLTSAIQYAESAHTQARRALGVDHETTALTALNLADLLMSQAGDHDRARTLYEEALLHLSADSGPELATQLRAHCDLATIYAEQGDVQRARQHHDRALYILVKVYGETHPATAHRLVTVGLFEEQVGAFDRARAYYQRSLELRQKSLGPDHPDVAESLFLLARLALSAEENEEADRLYQRALAIWESRPPSDVHLLQAARDQAALAAARARPPEVAAQPVHRVPAEYPQRALSRGIEGWVRVRFTVDADGRVRETVVVEAEPARVFDTAALRAVRQWRYSPRLLGGEPVDQPDTEALVRFVLP